MSFVSNIVADRRVSRSTLRRLAVLVITTLLLVIMMSSVPFQLRRAGLYNEGDVTTHGIFADRDFTLEGVDDGVTAGSSVIVKRGEVIVRTGEKVSALQKAKLSKLDSLGTEGRRMRSVIGYTLLSSFVLLTVYLFTATVWPSFHPSDRDLILMSITIVGSFFLEKSFLRVSTALDLSIAEFDPTIFVIAAPVALGGMLLQVTLGPASVFFFTTSFALLVDIFFETTWIFLLLIIMGNIVGAVSVRRCANRSVFLLAGTRVALINVIILFCYILLSPAVTGEVNTWRFLCAIFGGLSAGVLAAGLTPLAEILGKYVTDIKLLELGSLDRELLRDLAMEAPGTWNHSLMLGQMVEAAAEAIGANGLLARVGAYYHDIGKTAKPGYFTENQAGLDNKHDKLTPSMSALIIKAHVKDGMEMARADGLPEQIVEFIPQHHGTALIEYFYEKAKKEADEGEIVDESYYRYPGPKPQTKEAGILMLADGIEAAVRSLADPTPTKIQGVVQKLINRVFASGQLDECGLTLRDLHLAAKSFTRVLSAIYHRRVEYQQSAEKGTPAAAGEDTIRVKPSGEFVKRSDGVSGAEKTGDKGERASEKASERIPSEKERSAEKNGEKHTDRNGAAKKEPLKRLGMT